MKTWLWLTVDHSAAEVRALRSRTKEERDRVFEEMMGWRGGQFHRYIVEAETKEQALVIGACAYAGVPVGVLRKAFVEIRPFVGPP